MQSPNGKKARTEQDECTMVIEQLCRPIAGGKAHRLTDPRPGESLLDWKARVLALPTMEIDRHYASMHQSIKFAQQMYRLPTKDENQCGITPAPTAFTGPWRMLCKHSNTWIPVGKEPVQEWRERLTASERIMAFAAYYVQFKAAVKMNVESFPEWLLS